MLTLFFCQYETTAPDIRPLSLPIHQHHQPHHKQQGQNQTHSNQVQRVEALNVFLIIVFAPHTQKPHSTARTVVIKLGLR